MDSNDHIICSEHGEAYTTIVCSHLAENPCQQWYCDFPTEENPWPDAWCTECDREYLKEGEWNSKNEGCLSLKVICNHCYESAVASSVDSLDGDKRESWINMVCECHRELQEKHDRLEANFSLGKHKRWDFDQEKNLLVFSNDGVPAVFADIEFVGSISTKSNTWLWSWANFSNNVNVRTRIKVVRDFGEKEGFPHLTVPKWAGDEVDGWEVSGIAARILGAHGIYRVPSSYGFLFMALMDLRWAS